MLFKAFIRVVKSINSDSYYNTFASSNIVEERLIDAVDKDDVKRILYAKYPQFFQNGKVYEKETKDNAQFFYVVIFPLHEWEIKLINEGEWTCAYCGQVHDNKYISKPRKYEKLFGDALFCKSEDDHCLNQYKIKYYEGVELPDEEMFITKYSPNYIYKITEKSTGKCYVGKTRNAPFYRWWNHLKHSTSPFGTYLRTTKLSEWTFEVLEELPCDCSDGDVFRIESEYISKFNSIINGYNEVVSKKL